MIAALAWISLLLALLPLLLTLDNLRRLRPLRAAPPPGTAVSILIPARDEEDNIAAAITAALASRDAEIEVIVLDDHSTDRTAAIVAEMAQRDPRLRLVRAPPLPPGWNGKQHACSVLAGLARHPLLLFVDADVRLAPDGVSRAAAFLLARDIGLASGVPRQVTGSLGEALLIPLIHLVLLGYLPMGLMRQRRDPGLSAACGQLILVRRPAYEAAGGHAAIAASLHDGLALPRAFRRAGFGTDLFDATDVASCRMYRGWRESWAGFSKNATEGMAKPLALPIWTILLFGGHVLPWLLLGQTPVAVAAATAGLVLRLILSWRFRQGLLAALLHPVGVAALLALQWRALLAVGQGRPVVWRGRNYSPGPAAQSQSQQQRPTLPLPPP